MHRTARLAVPMALAAAGLGSALPAYSDPGPVQPGLVVISEVDTRGPAGGNDEFIELFNAGPLPVDLTDWALRRCNSSDTTQTSQVNLVGPTGTVVSGGRIPAGTVLPAGGYLLVANTTPTSGYSRSAIAGYDLQYRVGITDHTGVQLVAPVRDADGAIVTEVVVDRIGFSGDASTNVCVEGEAAVNSASNDEWTASRRTTGSPAPCVAADTGSNAADAPLAPQSPKSCNDVPLGTGVSGVSGVVVSEVDTSGPGTAGSTTNTPGNDEFIELHNNSALPVDLTGWTLWRCNSADRRLVSKIDLSASLGTIGAGATIYVHHSAWSGSAGVAAAATYGVGVSDGTGVRLVDATFQVADRVGLSGTSATNACVETAAAPAPAANDALSAHRAGSGTGIAADSGVNSADVALAARTPGVF